MSVILMVDDEADLDILIKQKFRKEIRDGDYTFHFARNGVQALKIVDEYLDDIDMIISDINMPEMDGLTLLQHLSEKERKIKTVIVSAYGDMKNIRTAMNRGAFDFLVKPIDFQDLETTIKKTLEDEQQLKEALKSKKTLTQLNHQLSAANEIQRAILPRHFPNDMNLSLYASMVPAQEVGGDFYDFFPIDDDRIGVVIADVSGKGFPAALFMAVSRTILKSTAVMVQDPGECFSKVNHQLSMHNDTCMFVTAFYGILNLKTGLFQYSNAGHCVPYIYNSKETGFFKITHTSQPALGVIENMVYKTEEIILAPGQGIFMYTDGVTEAISKKQEEFGQNRLEKILQTKYNQFPKNVLESVIAHVNTFSDHVPQADDITCLVFVYKPEFRDENEIINSSKMTLYVKNKIEEIGYVLNVLNAFCKKHVLGEKQLTASSLIVDELVTNIISYAFEDDMEHIIEIELEEIEADMNSDEKEKRQLKISIVDDGKPFDPFMKEFDEKTLYDSVEERKIGGLGIHLVKKFSKGYFYEFSHGKNMVTFFV